MRGCPSPSISFASMAAAAILFSFRLRGDDDVCGLAAEEISGRPLPLINFKSIAAAVEDAAVGETSVVIESGKTLLEEAAVGALVVHEVIISGRTLLEEAAVAVGDASTVAADDEVKISVKKLILAKVREEACPAAAAAEAEAEAAAAVDVMVSGRTSAAS